VSLAQNDVKMFAGRPYFRNRVLGDDATIVFDFDLDLIVRQHPLPELQDFREPVRLQPVIGVLPNMGLEQNRFALPDDPAAIDEVFHDVAHFGDMRVWRDEVTIRQNKTRQGVGMLFQDAVKIGQFHIPSIFLFRYIVKGGESGGIRNR
jgi:hypothetical protein